MNESAKYNLHAALQASQPMGMVGATTPKVPSVQLEADVLVSRVESIANLVGILETKLRPVLRNELEEDRQPENENNTTALSGLLHTQNTRLDGVVRGIQSILSRLEI